MTRRQTITLPHVRCTDHIPMHDIEDPTGVAFNRSSPSRLFGRGGPSLPRWWVDDDRVHANCAVSQRVIRRFGIWEWHGRVIIVRLDRRELRLDCQHMTTTDYSTQGTCSSG